MQIAIEIIDITLVRECQISKFQFEQVFIVRVSTQDMDALREEFQFRLDHSQLAEAEGIRPSVETATLLSHKRMCGGYIAAIIVIADYQSP